MISLPTAIGMMYKLILIVLFSGKEFVAGTLAAKSIIG